MRDLTQAELKRQLHYDPMTGVFTWLVSFRKIWAGKAAGSSTIGGYTKIGLNGKAYLAHRLARFYVTGERPRKKVFHLNQVRTKT